MDNDFSTYLLSRERVAQLQAEASAARLASLVRSPRPHPLDALRRRLAHALQPVGSLPVPKGAHR